MASRIIFNAVRSVIGCLITVHATPGSIPTTRNCEAVNCIVTFRSVLYFFYECLPGHNWGNGFHVKKSTNIWATLEVHIRRRYVWETE
ncbi:uncharacterized protein EV420DRAFT_1180269 [Desarmillaria tabescens]|uniref:Secreted protein n=1 Tax=Armillaria tabescens TaxID=1929756 RepID=A0AA39NB30_ARMTA|nr:uncharacterized protein EV420DRAFT_1180269 [Desarmillaria tabescens]KAK0462263.1 hypothetical protein EV420DRAFT_1180269 [Desarmillaria tabescens]